MTLRAAILAEFERHQQQQNNNDEVTKDSVQRIVQAVEEHGMADEMASLDLAHRNDDDKDGDDNDAISDIFQDILDCAIGNASLDASRRIVDLLANTLVTFDETALLDRLIQFSKCGTDSVRALATYMLSRWFHYLLSTESTNHSETLQTIQRAILVRCRDKAVAVRAETLALQTTRNEDPEVLTAGIFLLQHDPSAANRTLAAQQLPVSLQTAEYLVYRIRDVKASVRMAALRQLEDAFDLLDASQRAEIVHTGYTERCAETSQATVRVVCKWYKAVHFNITVLLEALDICQYPDAAETLLKILHGNDASNVLADEMSDAEQRAFRDGLLPLESANNEESYSLEHLFAIRVGVSLLPRIADKEQILENLIPDIPQLCSVLERNITNLVQVVSQDDDTESNNVDRLTMLCDQWLRLGIMVDVKEEGSRRVLVDAMKTFLSYVATPDALVSLCVETLLTVSHHVRNDLCTIFDKLQQLPDDMQEIATIRMLDIANVALEKVAVEVDLVKDMLTNENVMVRQKAVECYSKMGLYRSMEVVLAEHWPMLLGIARDDMEQIAIRSQSALALTDISVLSRKLNPEFCSVVSSWLEDKHLSGVASEMAVKLLVADIAMDGEEDSASMTVNTKKWIALLLLKFFDSSHQDDEEEDNEMEVGNPARLQQLLALFLPNFARLDREKFIGCIQVLLESSPKTTSTKIVEYVVQTAHNSPCETETSSPQLLASIQITSFLSERASDISKTLLRSLCKLLEKWEFDIETEFYDNLSVLKELLDEIITNGIVEDTRAEASLKTCFANLGEVEMEEDVEEEEDVEPDEEVTEDVVVADLEKLNITGEENEVKAKATPSPVPKQDVVKETSTRAEGSLRRSRRLRPSN